MLQNPKTKPLGQLLGYSLFVFSIALFVMVMALSNHQMKRPLTAADFVSLVTFDTDDTPNFSAFDTVQDKKTAFFEFLQPIVDAENQKLIKQRDRLLEIYSEYAQNASLSKLSQRNLNRLGKRFRLEVEDMETAEILDILLLRVDEIPTSMVLAQAAIESAWGTSRFAMDANNYFGQWCFKKGCGLVPQQRGDSEYHEVAKFKSVQASVASYMRNINTHNAYRKLRLKRANLRDQGQPVSSLALINELSRYSERGQEYINELRSIISVNELTKLDVETDKA